MLTTLDLLVLKSTKGIGDQTIRKIIKSTEQHNLNDLAQLNELLNNLGLSSSIIRKLSALFLELDNAINEANELLIAYEKKGIKVIGITDPQYSPLLKQCDDAPILLYCKGNLSLLKDTKAIAVIGTRKNTNLGQIVTQRLVSHWVEKGYVIVSGLAIGIDAIAHQQAVNNGGKCVAVLVSVDDIQPKSNRDLAQEILDKDGLLLAENPPDMKIVPALFAKRDRIQSGLSLAAFPIETGIKGGTLHAVDAAHRYSRSVYVPDPKSLYADQSIPEIAGILSIIQAGFAKVYTKADYDDIEAELGATRDQLDLAVQCVQSNQAGLLL